VPIVVKTLCYLCKVRLEHPYGEFIDDLLGAYEEALKRGSKSIPLTCPRCAQDILLGQQPDSKVTKK
jgi:hypothetical protein